MMTFKVGDKVRGISDNFKITNKDMTLAEVMSLEPRGIKIKILEHTNKSQIGKICLAITLEEHLAYFELVEEKNMNKIEELEKKYKELGEEIERLKEEQAHKPKYGEDYWFIRYDNEVISNIWYADDIDEARYELGNAFRTREEAEFRVEQLKVEAELRRFARPFVVGEENWVINYDVDCNEIIVFRYYTFQCCNIHFASEEIAQKAIDTFGEERIKKYYFGINE